MTNLRIGRHERLMVTNERSSQAATFQRGLRVLFVGKAPLSHVGGAEIVLVISRQNLRHGGTMLRCLPRARSDPSEDSSTSESQGSLVGRDNVWLVCRVLPG